MPILADYHLHSSFSGDSQASMEEMILRGTELKFERLCFTEHMDFDYPVSDYAPAGYFLLDTDTYYNELNYMREKYDGQVKVCFGVELGLQTHLSRKHDEYTGSYNFDFIIASSHLSNGKDPYLPEFYEGISIKSAYREYFESIIDNILVFDNFDVYGHLDYAVRYGKNKDRDYFFDDYREVFDEILTVLVNKGKGLEINTGGMIYGLKDLHPSNAILKRYKQLGGEIITIGSDAHTVKDIARGFDRAADVLKECGFKYYTVFEKRVAIFLPL